MVKVPGITPAPIQRPEVELPRHPETPYYPDSALTFVREGQRWTFNNGRVYLEGHDVGSLIADGKLGVSYWVAIAEGLNDYKKKVGTSAREVIGFAKFAALIDALLEKILGQMRKNYNEKIFGLKWQLQDGQFILNGINVRSFLALYRLRKTEKAKRFLKGLRGKLASIQGGARGNSDYEKVQDVVDDLVQEIDETLENDTSSSSGDPLGDRDPDR
ncbi:MAG: hypothetical protein Q7S98_06870 [Deltaproteobacteria bacterium]|nr:hypothetical protein [Deltaproteobacteria bacterium]